MQLPILLPGSGCAEVAEWGREPVTGTASTPQRGNRGQQGEGAKQEGKPECLRGELEPQFPRVPPGTFSQVTG